LALSLSVDGAAPLEPVARFTTNPAGAAIVNAIGPLRKVAQEDALGQKRYFVIVGSNGAAQETPLQVQRSP